MLTSLGTKVLNIFLLQLQGKLGGGDFMSIVVKIKVLPKIRVAINVPKHIHGDPWLKPFPEESCAQ